MVSVLDMNPRETIFEWRDERDGTTTMFAITRMIDWINEHIEEVDCCMTKCDPVQAAHIRSEGGIDPWKYDAIKADNFLYPIIYCETTDGYHILVDGQHRFVYASERGIPQLRTVILKPHQWEPFVIEPDPDIIMVLI